MKNDFVITSRLNNPIRVSVFGIEKIKTAPCIIFVHGFKGFKDWGFGPYIGKYFDDNGFCSVMFNFSHNGVGDSLTEFEELDKFAQNTFSLELSELQDVIDAYLQGSFGLTENKKIGLLGHSRGAAIAILTAAKSKFVSAVASWSGVSTFDRYSGKQKKMWRQKGFIEVLNTRTKQKMRLNVSLLDDLEANKSDSLNIEKAVRELKKPLLIAHGDQDLAVKIQEAEKLYECSDKSMTEIIKIYGVGHTFNISHPFSGSNEKFEELLNKTKTFFLKTLT